MGKVKKLFLICLGNSTRSADLNTGPLKALISDTCLVLAMTLSAFLVLALRYLAFLYLESFLILFFLHPILWMRLLHTSYSLKAPPLYILFLKVASSKHPNLWKRLFHKSSWHCWCSWPHSLLPPSPRQIPMDVLHPVPSFFLWVKFYYFRFSVREM